MKKVLKFLSRYLILLFVIWIPLNCATLKEKEKSQDLEKATPSVAEDVGPSYITSLKYELFGDRSRVNIKANKTIQYTAFKLMDPLRLIIDIPDIQPKPGTQESIQLNQGSINSISTQYFDESNITRIIIGLNQNVQYDITKTDNNELKIDIDSPKEMIVEADSPQETASFLAEESRGINELSEQGGLEEPEIPEDKPKGETAEQNFTGQLITLDFQKADLINVLRLIARISELNIITSPDVKGEVNLRLVDVPWDKALNIILKNNQLGMERDGNILRVASLNTLTAEKQAKMDAAVLEAASRKTKEIAEELVFKTIPISYADLNKTKEILMGMKSQRGDIKVDERTKTLIILDTQNSINEMLSLLKILDKRTKQVTIEARIVEVSTTFTREFGIQWGGTINRTTGATFPNTVAVTPGPAGSTSGFAVDLPAAAGAGAGGAVGLALGSITGATTLDIVLSAMEEAGEGKIISSPKITTANHKEATIASGRSIPYQSVSAEGTQTSFAEAAISLKVTPHITPDGYIHLEINTTKNEADFGNTSGGVPSILTKEATTEVLVKNGETTVLGGLYTSDESESGGGVPGLSKIPFLGWLFKTEGKRRSSQELLIFITPKIVNLD